MWLNYDQEYQEALKDPSFLAWRKKGAKYKAGNIVTVCAGIRPDSVIEIGCGTGDVLRELMSRSFAGTYTGTDISASALAAAGRNLGTGFCGSFISDAANLPLRDKTYSVAVLSHVLEHLDHPARAAQEASRVAEFVVAEVPTEKVATNWMRKLFFRRHYASASDAGHVQFWSPRSFVRFLQNECGFEILALQREAISKEEDFFGKQGTARVKPFVKHLLQNLLPGFLRIWIFTTHTTVLCRRLSRRAAVAASETAHAGQQERAHVGGFAA
jgi:ubiquinone/menaquinone biosynthesis C-methylase UbiE